MNNKTTNRDEFLLYAFMVGMFIFILMVLNNNNYSDFKHSNSQPYNYTQLSEIKLSATLILPTDVPNYSDSWITSDSRSLKQIATQKSFVIATNIKNHCKYKVYKDTHLKIKPILGEVSVSFLYSSLEYSDLPIMA